MELKEVLAKVLKGETLTEEEKTFLKDYDDSKVAAAARRKAEKERDSFKSELETAKAQIEKLEFEGDEGLKEKDSTIQSLNERLKKLEQKNADSENRLKAISREEKISEAFESAKIKPAAGISEKTFAQLRKIAFDGVDIEKEDDVKAALETFKSENAALIADGSVPGAGNGGSPKTTPTKVNPFSKSSYNFTEQLKLIKDNPEEAERLKAEAAAEPDNSNPGGGDNKTE